jgi:Flp pilus assembly protein TadB
MSEDLQRQVDFLNAQLRGGRALVKALERQLEEVKTERDKLAGIGIECGCGEASCTADADNLRDALAQIRRLIAAGDGMASSIQFNEEMAKDYSGATIVRQCVKEWNKAKGGKQTK